MALVIFQGPGGDNKFISEFTQRLDDCDLQSWDSEIKHSSKSAFYSLIKPNLKCEDYLKHLEQPLRYTLASFRCSVHQLNIEQGRQTGIHVSQRLCNICNLGTIEDEIHFLFDCPVLADLRRNFLPKYCHTRPNVVNICRLFGSTDKKTITCLAQYIRKAFEHRKEILSF